MKRYFSKSRDPVAMILVTPREKCHLNFSPKIPGNKIMVKLRSNHTKNMPKKQALTMKTHVKNTMLNKVKCFTMKAK